MNADPRPLNEHFRVRNELLEAAHALFQKQPSAILEAFLLLQDHPELKGFAVPTMRALWHARKKIDAAFRRDPVNRALFMEILRRPSGLTHALRRMNQHGVLGPYIPAFGRIVGRMQHDLFHVYTVDEHILMVVRNLRRFAIPEMAHEYPLLQPAVRGVRAPRSAVPCRAFSRHRQGPRRRPLETGNDGCAQVLQGARAVEAGHRAGGLAGGTASHHVGDRAETGSVRPGRNRRICRESLATTATWWRCIC